MIHGIYTMTNGRPVMVVEQALKDSGLITKNVTCKIENTTELTANPFIKENGPFVHIVI